MGEILCQTFLNMGGRKFGGIDAWPDNERTWQLIGSGLLVYIDEVVEPETATVVDTPLVKPPLPLDELLADVPPAIDLAALAEKLGVEMIEPAEQNDTGPLGLLALAHDHAPTPDNEQASFETQRGH